MHTPAYSVVCVNTGMQREDVSISTRFVVAPVETWPPCPAIYNCLKTESLESTKSSLHQPLALLYKKIVCVEPPFYDSRRKTRHCGLWKIMYLFGVHCTVIFGGGRCNNHIGWKTRIETSSLL